MLPVSWNLPSYDMPSWDAVRCEISRFVRSFFESLFQTTCKQIPVYDDRQIQSWHAFLRQNENQMEDSVSTSRKELHKENPESVLYRHSNPHNTYFDVTLDQTGQVTGENVSQVYRKCQNLESVKPLIKTAIESMLSELEKPEGVYQMGVSLLQHHHFQEASGMNWHVDLSDYTLVILLDDESDWTGGDFFFRIKVLITSFSPIRMTPKRGQGILFSNWGTQHKVEPFKATKSNINRTIFTVHLKKRGV